LLVIVGTRDEGWSFPTVGAAVVRQSERPKLDQSCKINVYGFSVLGSGMSFNSVVMDDAENTPFQTQHTV
jgi:hypothetical protein